MKETFGAVKPDEATSQFDADFQRINGLTWLPWVSESATTPTPPSLLLVSGWSRVISLFALNSNIRSFWSRQQSVRRSIQKVRRYSCVAKVRRSPAFCMQRATFATDAVVSCSPNSPGHSGHPIAAWVSRQQLHLLVFAPWVCRTEPVRWIWRGGRRFEIFTSGGYESFIKCQ